LPADIFAHVIENPDLYVVAYVQGSNFSKIITVGNVKLRKVFAVTFANRSVCSIMHTDEILVAVGYIRF